jgi:hydroxyacylglutathione hydrolase
LKVCVAFARCYTAAVVTAQAIPVLADNYAWLLRDAASGATGIVDPGEPAPVIAAIEAAGGRLDSILLTHHHADHVGGTDAVRARYGVPVIGAAADAPRLPRLDRAVADGESVALGASAGLVIATPGHTPGALAYYFPDGGVLLCGDTIFSLGCGRLLGGTAAQLFASLHKLAALPADTWVCCGHEYTEANARFALAVDPDNAALRSYAGQVRALRRAGRATVPSRLADELAANPFLRAPDVATLATLRAQKDGFKG